MICLAGFILSNLKKFSHQVSQARSKSMRKRETLMWKKWGQCLEQGVPSGGLRPMEYAEYASVFALTDIQRCDEGWTCLLTPLHRWWELRLLLVSGRGRTSGQVFNFPARAQQDEWSSLLQPGNCWQSQQSGPGELWKGLCGLCPPDMGA